MKNKFVVIGANRSGSTLLVDTLNGIEGICCHGELLQRQVWGYRDGFLPLEATLSERSARSERLLRERDSDPIGFISHALTREDSIAGLKILYKAFLSSRWQEVTDSLLSAPEVRYVHLVRNNSLRRFVSEKVALKGGPIHSRLGGRSKRKVQICVDIEAYQKSAAKIEAQRTEVCRLLAGKKVFDLSYEELAADTATTVARVSQFLGVEVDPSRISPTLRKVGAVDLKDVVDNYQELIESPATRDLVQAI